MKKAIFLKSHLSGIFVLAFILTLLFAGATATADHHEIPNPNGAWKGANHTLSGLKGCAVGKGRTHCRAKGSPIPRALQLC